MSGNIGEVAVGFVGLPGGRNGWVQGGNAFGATGVLGTTDGFDLKFMSHNRDAAAFLLPAGAANPLSTTGQLALPFHFEITARNATNTADVGVFAITLPTLQLGDASGSITDILTTVNAAGTIRQIAGGGETFVSHFADFGAKAQIKAPIDFDVTLARTAAAAGSASYKEKFQCQTVAATRTVSVYARPFDAITDTYALAFLDNGGAEIAFWSPTLAQINVPTNIQNAAPMGAIGTEQLAVTQASAAGAGNTAVYIEERMTGGASVAGSMTEFLVNVMDGASSETEGQYVAQYAAYQSSTGVINRQVGLSVICGGSPLAPAVALGTVSSGRGIEIIFDPRGGNSLAYTEAMSLLIESPTTDATHTIGTAYGVRIEDQGAAAAGVTTKIGLEVEAQTGGLGIINIAPMREDDYLDIGPIAAPANPAAGYWRLYVDAADGILKARNSAGTVRNLAVP